MHQEGKLSEQGLTGGYELLPMAEGIIYALTALGLPLAAYLSSGGAKYLKDQVKKYISKINPRKSQEIDKISDEQLADIVRKKSR